MLKTVEKLQVEKFRNAPLFLRTHFLSLQTYHLLLRTYWPIVVLLLYSSLFFLIYIVLYNSDIGRHIINGREILAGLSTDSELNITSNLNTVGSLEVLYKNYYSYTQTDFPAINHHWFFGVIVYWLYQLGGFGLLTWFNWLLTTTAFGLILASSLIKNENNEKVSLKIRVAVASFVGFLFMPFITNRAEVRPESLSLLLFALYYYLFSSQLILKKRWIIGTVLILQILWVNSHLFFILGPLLAGYFFFKNLLNFFIAKNQPTKNQRAKNDSRFWLFLTFGLFAISLINPNGVRGTLAPFSVFDNYAYRVAENQSTIFMINYGANVALYSYILACSFFVLLLSLISLKNKKTALSARISQLILLAIFVFTANKINRMSPFLAVVAIPIVASYLVRPATKTFNLLKTKFQDSVFTMIASTAAIILFALLFQLKFFIPRVEIIGTGLLPDTQNSAQFFIQNELRGPIFNNYDIGGYLAFYLFPREKLFIDNRPAEYSGEFLENEYLASLKDDNTWKQISEKYQINTIYFYRHDQIDGAQQFLYQRVLDPDWVPVYVDNFVIIFVKNSDQNKAIIDKFQLPQQMFVMNSN